MLKIIVVEDQKLILKDLCNKILKSYNNVEIVATATNGLDAYEKIIQIEPDIVFTDISMPGMNGIKLIEKVKLSHPSINFIILSGYKDFEYARNAIKLEVNEYLLKPVLVEDISKVLKNLENKISLRQNEYEKNLIEELLNSINHKASKLNMNFSNQKYYVLFLNFGNFSNSSLNNLIATHKEWFDFDLINASKLFLNSNEKIFISNIENSNQRTIVLILEDYSRFSIKRFCNSLMMLFNEKSLPITIAFSKELSNIEDIGLQNQMIKALLEKNIIFSKPTVIDCSEISLSSHSYRIFLSNSIEKRLKINLTNNDKKSFLKEFHLLLENLKIEKATQLEITTCLKSIFMLLFNKYTFKENVISTIELKLDECIIVSLTYEDLEKNLNVILEDFFEIVNKDIQNNSSEKVIELSIEYIKNNFSNDINVNDIANFFSISPAYFSRIFKKNTGIPPVAYLTKYRISKACELFKNTNFTVKEIAELCGYSDPFYFSKSFKSITGISPSEYKNTLM